MNGDTAWRELATWIGSLGDIHWTTLLVGVLSLALILLALRFLAPAGTGRGAVPPGHGGVSSAVLNPGRPRVPGRRRTRRASRRGRR